MNAWSLRYEGYDPEQEGLREALCTLGNGYMATRGAAPECAADGVHYPGTYAAGVFNRLTETLAGRVIDNESIVNLPSWLDLTFRIDGGEWFHVDRVEVLDYVQELDLREAVLVRRLRFRDEHNRTTALAQRRLVSMHSPHVCAQEMTVLAEDWSGRLEIRSGIDGAVRNTLVARYRDLAATHLDVEATGRPTRDSVFLVARTNASRVRIATAARTTVHRDGAPVDVERTFEQTASWVGSVLAVAMSAGEAVTVEKAVTVYTSRDSAITEPAEQAVRWLARLGGFEALLEAHVVAWRHLWELFDFEFEGSEEGLRVLRLHLLHTLQTLSPHTAEIDAGVPARGLHGEAYRGHVFWDELFVFPLLTLRIPVVTRALLRYRYHRLDEARQAAADAGYRGAMYPWQSGADGREETQQLHLNPMSGRWNPDPTHRQRHVGIAVAYNVWQYHEATDDREFLDQYGAEMIVEIARFWASIASYDRIRDRYVVRGVMGPDEFHTAYPGAQEDGLDNNAYTNVMAVWVLLRAMDALDLLPERTRRALCEKVGLGAPELELWQEISRKMYVPLHDDGVISQFEGYADLAELDWERYRTTYGDIRRIDRILEAEQDTPNRYKVSKQADVLMLFYLLSEAELREILDRLGYPLARDAIVRTIDYYLARSTHGSTLSAIVHAWVLARNHRERALDFYDQALSSDVADIQGGTTKEGIHLGAMAGSVDLLQRCFLGLELRSERLVLDPYWPEAFGSLTFAVRYRDVPLTLRVSGSRVEVVAGPGLERSVDVEVGGKVERLKPGSSVELMH